eukprot:scaffold2677_cov220-Pinguiococcus_pyrenoidosus.AAC.9
MCSTAYNISSGIVSETEVRGGGQHISININPTTGIRTASHVICSPLSSSPTDSTTSPSLSPALCAGFPGTIERTTGNPPKFWRLRPSGLLSSIAWISTKSFCSSSHRN